jgi:lipopolysaccharide/colanic/teichoic acid biosynthesis glycosyltransferase
MALGERSAVYDAVKRLIDMCAASIGLVVLSPLLVAVAVIIKLDSPGPALLAQQRVGKSGRMFLLYKFRTMYAGVPDHLHREAIDRWLAGRPVSDNEASGPRYKIQRDPRVTRVGSFLRRTSLDEMPQLLNVLLGEMSLVGPRPALPYELDRYTDGDKWRLTVKPGITGLWQVEKRGESSFAEMVGLDLEYIKRRGLMTDLLILVRTVPRVLSGRGAA